MLAMWRSPRPRAGDHHQRLESSVNSHNVYLLHGLINLQSSFLSTHIKDEWDTDLVSNKAMFLGGQARTRTQIKECQIEWDQCLQRHDRPILRGIRFQKVDHMGVRPDKDWGRPRDMDVPGISRWYDKDLSRHKGGCGSVSCPSGFQRRGIHGLTRKGVETWSQSL